MHQFLLNDNHQLMKIYLSQPDSNNFEIDISAPSIKNKPAMNKGKASIMLPDLNGLGFTSLCIQNKELLEK